ncbi:hypothetical protein MCEMIE11_01601 [Burkholderiales bacterium]
MCDPWIGKANTGGWQSFPEFPVDQLARHLSDARWVYLSHLHDDHFHPETLKSLNLLDREFILKRFPAPVMRERLNKLGVTRIREFDPFTINQVGSFDIAIFPQMTSNSSGLDDAVNYDLDTSIVLKADGEVFFNQVDNPLSTVDLEEVRNWILRSLGPIDICCLMSGAASEYPHLFLGIDQVSEKRRIVDESLTKLVRWLELLAPKYYFPAGGTYLIPGWLSRFGENVAQPEFHEIRQLIENLKLEVRPLKLEGGFSIDVSTHKQFDPDVSPIEPDLETAIRMHRSDPYDYETVIPPQFTRIIEILATARENWLRKIQEAELHVSQSIRFEIYNELALREDGPDEERRLGSYQLFETSNKEAGNLIIHIDQRALYGCLTRRFVWNGVLGSLCLFERKPNRHFPTDFFSLNFLTLTHDQKKAFSSN